MQKTFTFKRKGIIFALSINGNIAKNFKHKIMYKKLIEKAKNESKVRKFSNGKTRAIINMIAAASNSFDAGEIFDKFFKNKKK